VNDAQNRDYTREPHTPHCPIIHRKIPGAPQISAAPVAAINGRLLNAAAQTPIVNNF
jgi:hypothetical protein